MPIEQLKDSKRVDSRADLYALGAILYEMLCGQRAFPSGDLLALFKAKGSNHYPDPGSLKPDLAEATVSLVNSLLAADADDRPSSASDVLDRLGRDHTPRVITGAIADEVRKISAAARTEFLSFPKSPASRVSPSPATTSTGNTAFLLLGVVFGLGCLGLGLLTVVSVAAAAFLIL